MKMISLGIGAAGLLASTALAQSPVTVHVATAARGYAVPWDFGGATITNNAPWCGQWTALTASPSGSCKLKVPAAAAAVVKLVAR